MIKIIFIITLSISFLSCSLIPNDSNTRGKISLDGRWQSTYYTQPPIIIGGETIEIEHTSTLTIEDNTYQFVFDPPVSHTLYYDKTYEQISGIYTLAGNIIFFYDSTGQELKQELVYSIKHDTLSMIHPMKIDTTEDSSIVHVVPLGAVPWGYAMNVWEPFIFIESI